MRVKGKNPLGLLSGSTLKLIACLFMAIDHIGYHLYPDIDLLRIIGRLSMPIFAFLIAEGCYYTKNKLKHFLLVLISGLIFLVGVWAFTGDFFGNIFLQFAISILYVYLLDYLKQYTFKGEKQLPKLLLSILIFIISLIPGYYLFKYIPFDYDFFTTLIPVFVSLVYLKKYTNHKIVKYLDNIFFKVMICAITLAFVCIHFIDYKLQWYSFLAIPILLLYNEQPGIKKLKYFFYLFYPCHVIIIMIFKILFF